MFLIRYGDGSKELVKSLDDNIKEPVVKKVKHPFIPINKEMSKGIPIVLDQNVIKSVDIHPYSINMWRFNSKEENKPVKAENNNETYVFTDAEGNKYEWVLTLKRLYAQRITKNLPRKCQG